MGFLLIIAFGLILVNPVFGQTLEDIDITKIPNYENLLKNLEKGGHVEVIVELEHELYVNDELKFKKDLKQHVQRIKEIQVDFINSFEFNEEQIILSFKYSPQILMKINKNLLEELIFSPLVRLVHDNSAEEVFLDLSVGHVGAQDAFEQGITGKGYSIVIIDTGVDPTHSFLSGKILPEYEACFSVSDKNKTTACPNGRHLQVGPGAGAPCQHSLCYHGTHVAGIAAGNGSDFSGVSKDSFIIPVQVFHIGNDDELCKPDSSPCIRTRPSETNAALEYVIDLAVSEIKIAAVNLSLGTGSHSSSCSDDPRRMTIDILHSLRIPVVVSVGNSADKSGIAAPACISNAVSVGSTNDVDTVRPSSQSAQILDLLAPGATILSSVPDEGFEKKSGTSFSAPHVTGAFALLKQANPDTSVNDMLVQLKATGKPIIDHKNGIIKPRIQINEALSFDIGARLVELERGLEEVMPPLKQWEDGKSISEILCNAEKHLLINLHNGKPACVFEQTSAKLNERGWVNLEIKDSFQ